MQSPVPGSQVVPVVVVPLAPSQAESPNAFAEEYSKHPPGCVQQLSATTLVAPHVPLSHRVPVPPCVAPVQSVLS